MTVFGVKSIREADPMIVAKAQGKLVERMDPGFWDAAFLKIVEPLTSWKPIPLGQLIQNELVTPDAVRQSRGESIGTPPTHNVEYYTAAGYLETGYDTTQIAYCDDRAYQRLRNTELQQDDIVIGRSGVGSAGRVCYIQHQPSQSCTGDLFVVRVDKNLAPFLFIFLKSKFGTVQLDRAKHGVGSLKLKIGDIKGILIPQLSQSIRDAFGVEHKAVLHHHNLAMEAKTNMLAAQRHDNKAAEERYHAEYERNLTIAEAMLNDLIRQVEEIIEGTRTEIEPVDRVLNKEQDSGA